jgi:hypothetical protein
LTLYCDDSIQEGGAPVSRFLCATKNKTKVIRDNLKRIVEQSNCNTKEVIAYVKQFIDPSTKYKNPESWNEQAWQKATPEILAKELSCLGGFEFEKVLWGQR